MKNTSPVGIFDSGMGGLTVVKEFIRILPHEDIIYFGDTARVPYGPKSKETISRFSTENILFLLKFNVKMIIIACNTASSVALPTAEKNFKVPIIGVIKPGAENAVRSSKNGKIGVIGTRTTIRSGAYEKNIKNISANVKVYSACCPLFVPLVEEGWLDNKITGEIAAKYLNPLKAKGVDTLVLGCTHYPLLRPVIKKLMGDRVELVDSANEVVKEARRILKSEDLLSPNAKKGKMSFYVSDEPDSFALSGRRFLGFALNKVRKVSNV